MLQGKAILEFAREKKINNRIKREIVKRVEHKNTITTWGDDAINEGNFQYLISGSKIMPISQWFSGCYLTDRENDASLKMIAGNSNITAQAGDDAYSGINLRRGSFNSIESGLITGGIRNVWDWDTSHGNGTIASVCLTRAALAKAMLINSGDTAPDASAIEYLGYVSGMQEIAWLCLITVIDYENEVGYKVTYSSGTITVIEYSINTTRFHLLGDYLGSIDSTTHTITQTVTGNIICVSYTGDTLHVISVSGSTLYDYEIDTDDWTCTATSHSYSGVDYVSAYTSPAIMKDVYPIIDGYIYIFGTQKIYKCSLSNDADVTEYDNPLYTVLGINMNNDRNGPCLLLPNGDWYKFPQNSSDSAYNGIYVHNGTFQLARLHSLYTQNYWISVHGNSYGTQVCSQAYSSGGSRTYLSTSALLPYVSTVANLDEAVTKSADLTMKLTYEITQASA